MHLHLLGLARVDWKDGTPPRFRSQRTMALLGYLVAEQRAISRDHLSALFWPDEDLATSKANLRRDLHNLAQILPGCWQTSRVEVAFVPGEETAVDIHQIRACEAAGQWQAAAELIGGNFLEGVTLADNLAFETWLLGQQELWRQRAAHILQRATDELESQGAYKQAVRYAQRLLQVMPWREETHQQAMRLLALCGRRSEALKQFERCRAILWEELDVAVSPETQSLYYRIKTNPNFTLHNLPVETTPFIGRERELEQLASWLSGTAVRLITITGVGGMGKTRLAVAAARQFVNSTVDQPRPPFSHGIHFVDLAPVSNAEQIASTIAIAIDFSPSSTSRRSLQDQLLDYVRTRQMLLILDNIEHLLPNTSIISDLLAAAASLKIMVTSRERLKLQGEQVLPLDGLRFRTIPGPETADLLLDDAARLFLDTAQRNNPTFQPMGNGRAQISQICKLVDGMPLALELAAKWVDSMPLPEIVTELEQSLQLLEAEAPDLPARHRSVRAVFESSWEQLSAREQQILSGLSVFRGGFTPDAARVVTGASGRELSLLVSRSLLRFVQPDNRYRFHELLRQYAAVHLQANPDLASASCQRHLTYFCQVAIEGDSHLRGGNQVFWTNRLLQERNNLIAAVDWGIEHDLHTAVELATHLFLFWFNVGLAQEGEQLYLKLLPYKNQLPANLRAWLLTGYVAVIWLQWKFEEIEQYTREAIPLFLHVEDATGLALSHFHLSVLYGFQGQIEQSDREINRAIEYARAEKRDTWALSLCLHNSAIGLVRQGRLEDAREAVLESYMLNEPRLDATQSAYNRLILGRIALIQGEMEEAKRLAQSNLPVAQDLKDGRLEAFSYNLLGSATLAESNLDEAIDAFSVGLEIAQKENQADASVELGLGLGDAFLARRAYQEAGSAYRLASAIILQTNSFENMASCLEKLTGMHWQQGVRSVELVKWIAAAAAWREEARVPIMPPDDRELNSLLKSMQAGLSVWSFDAAWHAGTSLALPDALTAAANYLT